MLLSSIILCITAAIHSVAGFRPSHFRAITSINNNKFAQRVRLDASSTAITTLNETKNQSLLTEIARVSVPALAVCIIDPCLTLIDMFFVGKSTASFSHAIGKLNDLTVGTSALAGMSVNCAIFNVIAAISSPLCTGTLTLVAKARGQLQKSESTQLVSPGSILLNGLLVSTILGAAGSILLLGFSDPMIGHVFGSDAANIAARTCAVEYLRVRSLAVPLVLMNYVITGFCLGIQNIKVPVFCTLLSAGMNILGDYIFVSKFGLGLKGAAIATVLAALSSIVLALFMLLPKHGWFDRNQSLFRNIFFRSDLWLRISTIRDMLSTSLALLVGSVINTATYSSGSIIAAKSTAPLSPPRFLPTSVLPFIPRSLDLTKTTSVAAHQVAFQSWWFLSYFSSPVFLAAQSILHKDLEKGDDARVERAIPLMVKINVVVGLICTAVNIVLLKYKNRLFTDNRAVIDVFPNILWQSTASLFLVCITTALDGIFVGTNRMSTYLQACTVSTMAAWLFATLISMPLGQGTVGAWNGLLLFAIVRFAFYVLNWKRK